MIRGPKRGVETDDETLKAEPVASALMPSIPRKTHQNKGPPFRSPKKPQPHTRTEIRLRKFDTGGT